LFRAPLGEIIARYFFFFKNRDPPLFLRADVLPNKLLRDPRVVRDHEFPGKRPRDELVSEIDVTRVLCRVLAVAPRSREKLVAGQQGPGSLRVDRNRHDARFGDHHAKRIGVPCSLVHVAPYRDHGRGAWGQQKLARITNNLERAVPGFRETPDFRGHGAVVFDENALAMGKTKCQSVVTCMRDWYE
tara:strand:+ start:1835 stop:2395 length:561 start_codon:yes stop_codon:yes gene_type:complete